jgi:hypothetical protein
MIKAGGHARESQKLGTPFRLLSIISYCYDKAGWRVACWGRKEDTEFAGGGKGGKREGRSTSQSGYGGEYPYRKIEGDTGLMCHWPTFCKINFEPTGDWPVVFSTSGFVLAALTFFILQSRGGCPASPPFVLTERGEGDGRGGRDRRRDERGPVPGPVR